MPQQYYWIAFDIETSGVLPEYALQPWRFKQRKAWITTAAYSLYGLDGSMVSRGKTYPNKAALRQMLEMAIRLDAYVVTWNGTFDIAWLIAVGCGDLCMKVRWLDAMRMWKHLDISSSFATADHTYALKGEKGAAGVFLPDSVGREDDVDYHSSDPAELAKLLAYNKDDTADTLRVAELIWAQLDAPRRKAFLIECEALPLVANANLQGMHVDKKAVVKVNKRMVAQEAAMVAALANHGVTEQVVRSPKQLATLVFDTWGLKSIKTTAAGARSTDKDVMAELAVDDERAAQITQYREALNLKGKFIDGIVESMIYNEDEITRPQANIFGTYTGRFTYTSTQGKNKGERQIGFALHQMKRDKDFKNMIVAPEGYDLVEFDAAGQEFRWMAIKSADTTMLMLCADGEDAHSFMGAQIGNRDYIELRAAVKAGEDWAAKMRQGGKVGNLSLQYRTSPRTFRIRARSDHNLVISAKESERICKTYLQAYPGVPRYWANQIQLGRKLGYAETLAGRRVQVKGNWGGPMQWPMESTMINYPIQGTGGDQKYLAMSVLRLHMNDYDARFAWDLHDGIYFYVPKDKSLAFAHKMRDVLAALPYDKAWGFKPPIPLPWDAKVGPAWGSLKEIK